MRTHLRACLWLLILTVTVCCVLYPLALWLIGVAVFPIAASGSLVTDKDGAVRGSRLIAQPFSDPKYFQPRPSAVSYNASASGGSNYGASNPKLRGRVAQALGLIARYKKDGPRKGAPVGPDVEKWFAQQTKEKGRNLTAEWAKANPTLASEWVNSTDLLKPFVKKWAEDHPEVVAEWKKASVDAPSEPSEADLGPFFFASYARAHPGTFPGTEEQTKGGKKEKVIRPVTQGDEIRSIFFDTWLTENPEKLDPLRDLEQVPADMVMTSGSGLDPHITLRNAQYQLDGVVEARAKESKRDERKVRSVIEGILKEHQFTPLSGLIGEPLVNVLEVNRAMDIDEQLKPAP
jgi:K+-transporting ATPase ATPase C chain